MERVRLVDPLATIDETNWPMSPEGRRVFDLIVSSSLVDERARRRHRMRWAAGAAVATGAVATAVAASGIVGQPAPDSVKTHLAGVDAGLPDDVRVDPDVDKAVAVAVTEHGVLYATDLANGGYCFEIATGEDQPRGAICVTAAQLGANPVEVSAPIPAHDNDPLLVGGRINDEQVLNVIARFPDGTSQVVQAGADRYWMIEVPDVARAEVLDNGLTIAGVNASGGDVSTLQVPPLRDDDPDGTAHDRDQPIFVSTISDGNDLSLVLGVEGSVNVQGAVSLELQYPDGTTTPIAIGADGSYRFDLPADRRADFADSVGHLIARDAGGEVTATAVVSSVANFQRNP
jgi:hypothetical protein